MSFANFAWFLIPASLFAASVFINEKIHKDEKKENRALRVVSIAMAMLSLLLTMVIPLFMMIGLPTGSNYHPF